MEEDWCRSLPGNNRKRFPKPGDYIRTKYRPRTQLGCSHDGVSNELCDEVHPTTRDSWLGKLPGFETRCAGQLQQTFAGTIQRNSLEFGLQELVHQCGGKK